MSQTRRQSIIEATANITLGWVISFFINRALYSSFDYEITTTQNMTVIAVFSVASFVRSYAIRRYYNWRHKR